MSKKRPKDKPHQTPLPSPIVENLRQIVRHEISISSTFQGPLPPPDILARYNEAIPDGAERIVAMAEKQSAHRMELERLVVDADIKRANWGLVAGLIVALVGLVVSLLMVIVGNALAGAIVGSLDLVSLVAVFVYGTVSRRIERQQRAKILTGET